MDLAELKRKGFIKPVPIDKTEIKELLQISERDLGLAEEILGKSFDGALNLAYNAMLQAARALMFSYGYRPDSEFHHKATVEFVSAVLDKKYLAYVESLDRIRSKRIIATYEKAGAISEFEARYAIKSAKEFITLVKQKIK
jgi:uncharacterized protein (UPF0332 family)